MLKILSDMLQQIGLRVIEAKNGKDGLQLALTQRPALVLTDNFMPIMNGLDMVVEIRKDPVWGATVPVVVMTNVNDMNAVNKALATTGVDYLMKSEVQLDQIVATVKQRLGIK
jgi:CheY-like chemotaxis protein